MSASVQRHPSEPDAGEGGQALRAIVVFEDRADARLLRLLRPGFRHCFCLVGAGRSWAICDPLKTRIELTPLFGLGESELAGHYAGTGRSVVVGPLTTPSVPLPWRLRPVSCVEIVKRVLRLHAPWVLTPAQLHRALLGRAGRHAGFSAWVAGEQRTMALDSGRL